MGKSKVSAAVRAALVGVLALVIGQAVAGTSSTTVYPTLSIFDSFAAQPFDPIDPSASGISVNVTGTWTFVFGHDAGAMPYTGDVYFGPTGLEVFVAGPHGNDGTTTFDVQIPQLAHFENFTGTETFVVNVDKTTYIPGTGNNLQNFTGPGEGMLYIEGPISYWLPGQDMEPGSIMLAGSVQDLTVRMTAVPEPAAPFSLLAGLGVLCWVGRRSRG